MPYIHFTDDQKQRAASVDLVDFLSRQGEKLIRSGSEYRLGRDHSVTVRGNEWYDHAIEEGGGPISFVRNFYHLSYPEAVTRLLGGEQGTPYEPASKKQKEEPKEFVLPAANREMRRLYAYLLKKRLVDREVLNTFVRAGLIYESCEKSKDGQREYHNAVFVGKDEHGVARHAHKRSVSDMGKPFRINVEGCDPRYSFHRAGTSDRLYVFEAPIDLLSFLSLYPKDWQKHSYVALCGTAEHAMLWMLEQNSDVTSTILCLDHDEAGIEAAGRLTDILREQGYHQVTTLLPEHKDWNEELKARCGMDAQPAEEHPQHTVAPGICKRIAAISGSAKLDRIDIELPALLEQHRNHLHWGRFEKAMNCMERMSALALATCGRELRQLGTPASLEELAEALRRRILPHQNRGKIHGRHSEIAMEIQSVLARYAAPGIRSPEDKQQLANAWLALASSCAKIPVKYETEALKQENKTQIEAQQSGFDLERRSDETNERWHFSY